MDANFKSGLSFMYRDHVSGLLGYEIPNVTSAEALLELAKKITVPAFEEERGWRTDPPFPGTTEAPEEMRGRWRMICATRFYVDDREMGVIFMTLVSGRPTGLIINAPHSHIPQEYLPLASR
jgi:hypothetical protein